MQCHGSVEQALVDRIVEGPVFERDGIVAFRGADARRLLREEHGLTLSLSAVYRLLHRNRLVPRPRHPRSDATPASTGRCLLSCVWRVDIRLFGSPSRRRATSPMCAARCAGFLRSLLQPLEMLAQ